MMNDLVMSRRAFLVGTTTLAASLALTPGNLMSADRKPNRRAIPSTGELLPVVGMGTWITFDVGDDAAVLRQLTEVMRLFFDLGGRVVDSSPMYGRAEAVVGDLLQATGNGERVFAATKVWTDGRQSGIDQMERSRRLLGVESIDLMQIHNLRDWRSHLPVLRLWKEQGRLRYIGLTTSHGLNHTELEGLMRSEEIDFVQFTYNIEDREAERRLLPLAAERGIATLINRPFRQGSLFRRAGNAPLPDWAAEIDCATWGQFFLKFIVSHPAVTCVIPATSKAHHMRDNMEASYGQLPDEAMRRRMLDHFAGL